MIIMGPFQIGIFYDSIVGFTDPKENVSAGFRPAAEISRKLVDILRRQWEVEDGVDGNCANSLQGAKVICDPATNKATISGSTFLVIFSEGYPSWQSLV